MPNEPDWKQQAEQFKADLDRVNPLLDARTAQVGELQAKLQLAGVDAAAKKLTLEKSDYDAKTAKRTIADLQALNETTRTALDETKAELEKQKARADKLHAGLSAVFEAAGTFSARIHDLIAV